MKLKPLGIQYWQSIRDEEKTHIKFHGLFILPLYILSLLIIEKNWYFSNQWLIKVVNLLKYALLLGGFKRQVSDSSSVWFKCIIILYHNNKSSRYTGSETSVCSYLPKSNSFLSLRVKHKTPNIINLIFISSLSSLSLTLYYRLFIQIQTS